MKNKQKKILTDNFNKCQTQLSVSAQTYFLNSPNSKIARLAKADCISISHQMVSLRRAIVGITADQQKLATELACPINFPNNAKL
jgi:hypothetical protein